MQLYLYFLIFIFFLYKCASDVTSRRQNRKNCSLQTSAGDIAAGVAREMQAVCMYNTNRQKYFYEISWKAPYRTKTPVSGYLMRIYYHASSLCFQINSATVKFIFDESVGFESGKRMRYAVVPQPITRVGGKFSTPLIESSPCPPSLKLMPLPNKVLTVGSNFFLKCMLEVSPVHNISIEWSFTPDVMNCKGSRRLVQNSTYVIISRDKKVLNVREVRKEHEGCYTLTVENGVGDVQEERGYLHLRRTQIMTNDKTRAGDKTMIILALALGAGLLSIITSIIVAKVCLKRHRFAPLPLMKVYISRYIENDNDIPKNCNSGIIFS